MSMNDIALLSAHNILVTPVQYGYIKSASYLQKHMEDSEFASIF